MAESSRSPYRIVESSSDEEIWGSYKEKLLANYSQDERDYYEKLDSMTIFQERAVPRRFEEELPFLHHLFKREGWEEMMKFDKGIDIEAVKEFYATAFINHVGAIGATVRGTDVRVTADAINTVLGLTAPREHSIRYVDNYTSFIALEPTAFQMLGARFLGGEPFSRTNNKTNILPTDAKVLHHIICHNLLPTQNPQWIKKERFGLVYSIVEDHSINVGQLIFSELYELTKNRSLRAIIYPMIITSLCAANEVELPNIHMKTHSFKIHGLTKIQGVVHQQEELNEEQEVDGQQNVERIEFPRSSTQPDPSPADFGAFMTNMQGFMDNISATLQMIVETQAQHGAQLNNLEQQFAAWRGAQYPHFPPPPPPPPPPHPTQSSDKDFCTAPTSTSSDSKSPSPPASSPSLPPQIPITWPDDGTVSSSWVTNLMQAFDWASRALCPSEFPSVLPVAVFDKLVLTASKILHKEPNCVRVGENLGLNPESSRVVVVGDVHGQLHDVLFLLKDSGYPSEDQFFVFNGDYVDRGAWGLEVFLLLLAWKVLMPHRVYLLRGNHESKYCTSVYGFEKEVMTKYGDNGKHAYRKCLGCFEELPLASIITGKVYTAHGGLFRGTIVSPTRRAKKTNRKVVHKPDVHSLILGSLDELANARRSVLDPPWEGSNLIPGDVLWSDPSMSPGLSPNTERGIGLLWGPDCTEEFLKKFNLKLIIRSHEGPDARDKRDDLGGMDVGYTIDHIVESGKLITLFSAPDYPQFQATKTRYNNKGAYIVLEPPNFDIPIFHSFEAATPRPKANPYYDFEDCIDSDEELDLQSMVTG